MDYKVMIWKEPVSPPKPHLSVTAALIVCGEKVLITRRQGSRHAGWWEFPGGKQEPDESLEECLRREIKEELGLDIEPISYYLGVDHDYGDFSLTLHSFYCLPASGSNHPAPGNNSLWVKFSDLAKYTLLPPDEEIARVLRSRAALGEAE
ncbi:MAG: (deoxy)nucleoside triphosphate pyrophosphohydrolase [Pseudomonadota bacterium]